jgi:hypothetical protein
MDLKGRAVAARLFLFPTLGWRADDRQAVIDWSGIMKRRFVEVLALIAVAAGPAVAHDCRVVGNAYLRGTYEGECNEKDEIAHGQGEARGADTYVGGFVKGRPEGKGVYTWDSGGRLDGTFKGGKANGPGVYVSAKGVRYEGGFENGRLAGMKTEDCPATPGPLSC